jgi:hypothetical protein
MSSASKIETGLSQSQGEEEKKTFLGYAFV